MHTCPLCFGRGTIPEKQRSTDPEENARLILAERAAKHAIMKAIGGEHANFASLVLDLTGNEELAIEVLVDDMLVFA
ncbi:MAG: hypothetical protein WCV85_05565 [Patescibacteria group bacterium]|jgi:hypothetical protein